MAERITISMPTTSEAINAFQEWMDTHPARRLDIPPQGIGRLIPQKLTAMLHGQDLSITVLEKNPICLTIAVHSGESVALGGPMDFTLEVNPQMPGELHVSNFQLGEDFQCKGIGTEFYQQLREVAKIMGFRYITGVNDSVNIDFFTRKLGRVPLSKVNGKFIEKLLVTEETRQYRRSLNYATIDFLHDEDKAAFIE